MKPDRNFRLNKEAKRLLAAADPAMRSTIKKMMIDAQLASEQNQKTKNK